jgi:hypothetical protein
MRFVAVDGELMWIPSMRARTAADSSTARVNRAVERGCVGLDTQRDEALAELVGADVLSGALAREQPGVSVPRSRQRDVVAPALHPRHELTASNEMVRCH